MDKICVFAMYLPQYHETDENNLFWGKGFTDWVSVKNAVPLFDGHCQPRIPKNENYYDLSIKENVKWQADLAKKNGISGFGIYHYWFNSEERALTKPAEILLENKDIEIPFFFAWDNASWKRTWSKIKGNDWSPIRDNHLDKQNGPEILIEYRIGKEDDWKIHFEYLLPYFIDERYVKSNNRPLFIIYNYSEEIKNMAEYWDKLARDHGFSGMEIIYSYNPFHGIPKTVNKFSYEPLYSGWGSYAERLKRKIFRNKNQKAVQTYDYDKVWKTLLKNARSSKDHRHYYGAFVDYDDSPRRGVKGKVILGATPQKFAGYLSELIKICIQQKKKYIFLTAWNEWGEGAYLEPDVTNDAGYLSAVKECVDLGRRV